MRRLTILLAALLSLAFTTHLDATPLTLGFNCITNNDDYNADVGEGQLLVDILDGGSEVTFVFRNTGPEPATIAEIYFGGSPLFSGITDITGDPGVVFVTGAHPSNLPGGNTIAPAFEIIPGLAVEAQNPAPANGVNPYEQVELLLSLSTGKTWQNVVEGITSGSFRIGLHVISMSTSGGSEAFVNDRITYEHTPEPATLAMLALGFIAVRRGRLLR